MAEPRRDPRLTELGVPEAVDSGDQLSSETLTPAADPVYLHPDQTGERRNTALSLCLFTSPSVCLSMLLVTRLADEIMRQDRTQGR